MINSRNQNTATACVTCLIFLFRCDTFCPLTVCVCTPCQRASYISQTIFFLWGHGPETLACKARISFDGSGISLSVSFSLSFGYF